MPDVAEPLSRFLFVIHLVYCALHPTCPFCNRLLTTIIPCFAHIQSHFPEHVGHLMEINGQRIAMYYQHYADDFLETIFPIPPQLPHYGLLSAQDFLSMNASTRIRGVTLVIRPSRHFHRRLWEHRRRRFASRAHAARAHPTRQIVMNNAQPMYNPISVAPVHQQEAIMQIPNPNLETRVNQQEMAAEIREDGLTRQYLEQLNRQYHFSGMDEPNGDNNDMDLNLSL